MKRKQREQFSHDMAALMMDVSAKKVIGIHVVFQLVDGRMLFGDFGNTAEIDHAMVENVENMLAEEAADNELHGFAQ